MADAMKRVAELKAHIERLERDGHDTSGAIELLGIFETSLKLMIEYRDQIAKAFLH